MNGSATDIVVAELNKLAMCKRGTLSTEHNKRSQDERARLNPLRSEPLLSKPKREAIFEEKREELTALLKFNDAKELSKVQAASYGSRTMSMRHIFTPDSVKEYQKATLDALKHEDHDQWVADKLEYQLFSKRLTQEIRERTVTLDAEFQEAKMNFVSEAVPLKDFNKVYAELEQKVY